MFTSNVPALNESPPPSNATSRWRRWQWLITPAPSIQKQEDRRQVRLLATLLLVLVAFMAFGAVMEWWFGDGWTVSGTLAGGAAGTLLAYGLSRTRHHHLGAALAVAISAIIPFILILLNPYDASDRALEALSWLVVSILLGKLLLSMRGLVIVIGTTGLALILLPIVRLPISLPQFMPVASFVAVVAILTLVAARHRNLLEQDRLAEIVTANRELDALRASLEQRVEERTAELAIANAALRNQIAASQRMATALAKRSTELEETQNFLNATIEALPLPLFVKDAHTFRYILWNRAAEELLGRNRGNVLGKSDQDLLPPELAERFIREDSAIASGREVLDLPEEPVQTKAKGLRLLHKRKRLIMSADGSPKYVLGMFEDITERKRAEAAREQSEALFRALFEHSPDAVVLIDPHDPHVSWPIIDCNTAACQMNGYSRTELIGQSIDIVNISPGTKAERAAYLAQLRTAPTVKVETHHRHRDGAIFPIEVSTALITVGGRELVLGIDRDITERKQAEAALHESVERYRAVTQSANDAIISADDCGNIIAWNQGAQVIYGYTEDEVLGKPLTVLMPERYRALHQAGLARVRDGSESHVIGKTVELHGLRKNGNEFPIELSLAMWETKQGRFFTGILRDVTERKKTEETLRRQGTYLAALHDTTLGLLSRLEITDLLDALLNSAVRLLDASCGYIYQLGPDGDVMELKVDIGLAGVEERPSLKPSEGMVGMVWQSGQPMAVDDYNQWPDQLPSLAAKGRFGAVMAAPILSASQVIGVIGLAHARSQGRVFGDDEVKLVTRFAQLAAVGLDNARLLDTERAARHQAETLRAATEALSASLDLQTVLGIILTKLKEVVPYDSASVQEIRQGVSVIVGGDGFPDWDKVCGLTYDITSDLNPNREVIGTRQPVILDDIQTTIYPGFRRQLQILAGIHSWMGVPLLFGEHVIGMITFDKKEPNFYTAAHAQLALAFAAQAAIAINNARTFTAAQEYAAENAALYRAAAQLLNPGSGLSGLAAQIARAVTDEFALADCSVLLMNDAATELRVLASADVTQAVNQQILPLTGPGLTVAATRLGEMVYAPDVTTDPRYLAGNAATRSELVIPLKHQERVIGILDLQSPKPNAFDERAQRIITTFAKQAELALENARLVENLAQAYRRLQDDQQQLLAAEKMASLGRLTAGIAHEMNTPLAAVRSGLTELSHLIAEYKAAIGDTDITPEDHGSIALDMEKAVQLANTAAERAAAFVRSVKSQTREPSSKERLRFKIVPVIQDALLLLSHALRYSQCTVNFIYDADDLQLVGSPGRLAQVVTNLVTNAIDASAVNGGGPIEVRVTHTATTLTLQVSDAGIGIPPELLNKIFEPMFTTKPFGQGTGLGLTIIHDIVTGDFGGTIEVASQPNQGAMFTIQMGLMSDQ